MEWTYRNEKNKKSEAKEIFEIIKFKYFPNNEGHWKKDPKVSETITQNKQEVEEPGYRCILFKTLKTKS